MLAGIGPLLGAILRRRSRARGVLIDSPEIAEQGREYLASIGVGDRVQIVGGDLFGELRAQADVYVLKWILHDWSDATCRDILQRVRDTMSSGSGSSASTNASIVTGQVRSAQWSTYT